MGHESLSAGQIREALLDTSNALVPGTMSERAHDALLALDTLVQERDQAREPLRQIAETARWYADNGLRDPHEVDHALCVEILSIAETALEGDDL